MKSIKLTESEVRNCTWTFTGQDEFYRYYTGKGTHPRTGLPIEVLKKEYIADEALQSLNSEERNARDAKSWSSGSGSDKGGNMPMVRVARIPLAKLFDEVAPKIKEGDTEHLRWFLNQEANQPFRTKSGRL